jgi:stress response protein YsnF
MSQTVIGIFENAREADNAVEQLVFNGFTRERIDVAAQGTTGLTGSTTTATSTHTNDNFGDGISRFFSSLFDTRDEADNYSTVASRGTVVTVHTNSTADSERAAEILDQYGAVDVNERAQQYRNSLNSDLTTTTSDTLDTTRAHSVTDETTGAIPIIEEELQVGKRVVETGGVRLRSRIIERPVEESLRLRVEHVHVERNAVNRLATEADLANFQQGTVEMTERAEVPVVGKEARVVEEVRLQKDVEEREETIRGTVRRTDVDVENLGTDDTTYRTDDTTYRSDDADDDLNRPANL